MQTDGQAGPQALRTFKLRDHEKLLKGFKQDRDMVAVATVYNRLERAGVGRGACYNVQRLWLSIHTHINLSSVT